MDTLRSPTMGRAEVLGIDFCGVTNIGSDDFYQNDPRGVPPMAGAFKVLPRLSRKRFGENIWVISAAGPRKQKKTRDWFECHDGYARMLIPPEHVLFSPDRAGKAEVCKKIGVTHFIDDRLEILLNLDQQVIKYLFRPSDLDRERQRRQFPDSIHVVDSWQEVGRVLLPE
ncbi:MAG: hypothetical protein WAP23_02950 [Candidatus Spechtbacterales bacterium]